MLIAVDIDGTLFDCRARAHLIPADPTRTENWVAYNHARNTDKPRQAVIDMVNTLAFAYTHKIVLVTSVGERALYPVNVQLQEHNVLFDVLDMRPMEDHRTAFEYKMERYRELKPDIIIEDHPGIVAALRLEGFTVLQIDSLDPTV